MSNTNANAYMKNLISRENNNINSIIKLNRETANAFEIIISKQMREKHKMKKKTKPKQKKQTKTSDGKTKDVARPGKKKTVGKKTNDKKVN